MQTTTITIDSGGGGGGTGNTQMYTIRVTVGGGGATINVPATAVDNSITVVFITQGSSPGTVTWGAGYKFAPSIPVIATTQSVVTFYGNSADSIWYNSGGSILGRHS